MATRTFWKRGIAAGSSRAGRSRTVRRRARQSLADLPGVARPSASGRATGTPTIRPREQYAKLSIPILTITGSYDDDQPGALAHYREYMKNASPEGRATTLSRHRSLGSCRHAHSEGGIRRTLASARRVSSICRSCISTGTRGPCRTARSRRFFRRRSRTTSWVPIAGVMPTRSRASRPNRARTLSILPSMPPTSSAQERLTRAQPARGAPDQYVFDPRDVEHRCDPDADRSRATVSSSNGWSVHAAASSSFTTAPRSSATPRSAAPSGCPHGSPSISPTRTSHIRLRDCAGRQQHLSHRRCPARPLPREPERAETDHDQAAAALRLHPFHVRVADGEER